MNLPQIVSKDEWTATCKEFLVKEKEATKQRDALNAEHRELPMVQIDNQYEFDGPDGRASLLDLFERRKQLNVHHLCTVPTGTPRGLGQTQGPHRVRPRKLADFAA